jgi:hypothetical protein
MSLAGGGCTLFHKQASDNRKVFDSERLPVSLGGTDFGSALCSPSCTPRSVTPRVWLGTTGDHTRHAHIRWRRRPGQRRRGSRTKEHGRPIRHRTTFVLHRILLDGVRVERSDRLISGVVKGDCFKHLPIWHHNSLSRYQLSKHKRQSWMVKYISVKQRGGITVDR